MKRIPSLSQLFSGTASFYIKILRSFFLFYILLGAYGWFLSDSAIFFPPAPTYEKSDNILLIDNNDQHQIAAVYLKNATATHTILYSHGNAVDLGGLRKLIRDFYGHGYSVLAYDYSGYGLSNGAPSEQRAYTNSQAAYDYLVNNLDTKPESIIAYGHSLGGAIAADLASKNPVAGLILESTFVSAFRVRTVWPIYPFDKFDTLNKITSVKAPILVMHSMDDPIIPFWHSQTLFSAANKPKMNYWAQDAGHGGISHTGTVFWNVLTVFVRILGEQEAS
jgi:fermentation-respiration switch protein FrsA (DUF1100 family)